MHLKRQHNALQMYENGNEPANNDGTINYADNHTTYSTINTYSNYDRNINCEEYESTIQYSDANDTLNTYRSYSNNINDLEECIINTETSNVDNFKFGRYYKDDKINNTLEHETVNNPRLDLGTIENTSSETVESMSSTPEDDYERAFDLSECAKSPNCETVCRGIVNPNYPGFQHLAHTLLDYPLPSDRSFYSLSDFVLNENENNNNYMNDSSTRNKQSQQDILANTNQKNNNVNTSTHINTQNNITSVIGDFNIEINDELNHLFKDNLNFQEDLDGLKKEIHDSLQKPIEKTINHISEVVNNVIKQMINEKTERGYTKNENNNQLEIIANVCQTTEVGRPDFLTIDNNGLRNSDAKLSNAKEEIDVRKYETNEVQKLFPSKCDEPQTESPDSGITSEEQCDDSIIINTDLGTPSRQETTTRENKPIMFNILETTKDKENLKQLISSCRESLRKRKISPRILKRIKPLRDDRNIVTGVGNKSKQIANKIQPIPPRKSDTQSLDIFDVYSIETALPVIDIDAIEHHMRAAREDERWKRNDREEIRKRLAMGMDEDDYSYTDRPGRKPSLQSRLQNGKNLQICFMNESADFESISLENENRSLKSLGIESLNGSNYSLKTRPISITSITREKSAIPQGGKLRPSSLSLRSKSKSTKSLGSIDLNEKDFYAVQSRLQTEARIALAQAKEMAKFEMERSKRARSVSPVTGMMRTSLLKANCPLPPHRRRVSRQMLTDMNIAQLQVIVNELHTQIETLNENLVMFLMQRDELHMSQDSMLVDIEDLTRFFEMKQQSSKSKPLMKSSSNIIIASVK